MATIRTIKTIENWTPIFKKQKFKSNIIFKFGLGHGKWDCSLKENYYTYE